MKRINSSKLSGVLFLSLILMLLPALTGCRKERTANVSDILATVPSSAGAVVGLNLNSILVKAGCQIEGSKIIPGKELEKLLASSQSAEQFNGKSYVRKLLKGESGIDPNGLILFTDAYDTYITGVLADTEKFTSFISENGGTEFTDAGDNVKVSGNVAICGAQFWIITSGSIDEKAIKNFTKFEQSQSFASLPNAAEIANMTHDMVGYGQIKSFMRSGLLPNFIDLTYFNLVSGILFDNATSLSFNLDFLKGSVSAKALVLNDAGKPAKYLLPADKIDMDVFSRLPEKANALAAISLPKSLIKKIEKTSESLGGNMLGNLKPIISSLDGTTAITLANIEQPEKNLTAVITTDGKPSLELMNLLSFVGNTQKDGKFVRLSNGVVSGEIDVKKAAEKFKSATMGIVVNPTGESIKGAAVGIKTLSFSLNPESGSISFNVDVETIDPNENSLLTIIRETAK